MVLFMGLVSLESYLSALSTVVLKTKCLLLDLSEAWQAEVGVDNFKLEIVSAVSAVFILF